MPLITSANIACGGHAGNENTMRTTVELAMRNEVAIGAHPGYPDRERFGRVPMDIPARELIDSIQRQVDSLVAIASRMGARVTHVKAHGALYNQGERDAATARNIIFGIQAATGGHDLVIVAPPGSAMVEEASGMGMKVAREGFVDRAYEGDGTLQSRSIAGSVLTDPADGIDDAVASRARALADAWDAQGEGPAVPAYASVVVRFDPLQLAPAAAEATVLRLAKTLDDVTGEPRREIEIPTHYDGPDLLETAERSKLSVEELIALHSGREYRAFFLGFLPGFAYCGVLDPRIVAPRLLRPRERVPAGSVAIADGQTSVYPFDSPGGWRLIGRTDVRVFDSMRDPPVLIRPGDRVRFVAR